MCLSLKHKTAKLEFFKSSLEYSRGSTELPNQNLRHIGQGVPYIQTNRQTNRHLLSLQLYINRVKKSNHPGLKKFKTKLKIIED